jgi:hypothetical protein
VFVREMHDYSPAILSCLAILFRVSMLELITLPIACKQSSIRARVCVRIRFNIDGGKNKAYDCQQIRPWQ